MSACFRIRWLAGAAAGQRRRPKLQSAAQELKQKQQGMRTLQTKTNQNRQTKTNNQIDKERCPLKFQDPIFWVTAMDKVESPASDTKYGSN